MTTVRSAAASTHVATVTFRPGTAADALCYAVLGQQVFLDTYATDGIRPAIAREVRAQFDVGVVRALLAAPTTRSVVAERNAHLIGFAQCVADEPHAHVQAARPIKLDRLYVQERFAGGGVGTALLARVETLALAEGFDAMWLTAWVGNARALAFYPVRGFVDVGPTDYVFEDEAHENRVFVKALR